MQRPIHDVDITTSATPDEIESIFDKTIPVGKEHGTINVVFQNDNMKLLHSDLKMNTSIIVGQVKCIL